MIDRAPPRILVSPTFANMFAGKRLEVPLRQDAPLNAPGFYQPLD